MQAPPNYMGHAADEWELTLHAQNEDILVFSRRNRERDTTFLPLLRRPV